MASRFHSPSQSATQSAASVVLSEIIWPKILCRPVLIIHEQADFAIPIDMGDRVRLLVRLCQFVNVEIQGQEV